MKPEDGGEYPYLDSLRPADTEDAAAEQHQREVDAVNERWATEPRGEERVEWKFDDGSRWELGDSMAGGAHADSTTVNGQMVPGFITLRIVSADGDEQEHRYNLAALTGTQEET